MSQSSGCSESKSVYSNLLQKIRNSVEKAKCDLSKVAQEINGKSSYKDIDKNIEQQQEKENYSLSTKKIIHSQHINDNQDDSDKSDNFDDEWMEIVITKKSKSLNINQSLINNEYDELLQIENNNNNKWQCNQCTLIQSIYNDECSLCHSKNPSIHLLEEKKQNKITDDNNDYLFALELDEKEKRINDDEKLAMDLQKNEEKEAQNMRIQIRNSYPSSIYIHNNHNNNNNNNNNRVGLAYIFMNILGVDNNNYNISDNNNYIQQTQETEEREWNRLPLHVLTSNDIILLYKTEEKRSCAICMVEYKIGDETRALPCFHLFHRECIDIWFNQQNDRGNHASCPLDRKKITDAVKQHI